MNETPLSSRYRTEPEPFLRHREPRRYTASGILNPPGRWRSLFTFTVIILLLATSAAITAVLVYRQGMAQSIRRDIDHILTRADNAQPEAMKEIIPILIRHADLLGREETGERLARYLVYLALFHQDTNALTHAAEARSLSETRSMRKGTQYRKIFEIARLLSEKRFDKALLEAEKALLHFPRSDLLMYELALARIHLFSWEAAHSTLEMALVLGDHKQIPVLVELATLERRRGQYERAHSLLDQVLRRSPSHAIGRLEKQLVLAFSGQPFDVPRILGDHPATTFRVHLLESLHATNQGDFSEARKACDLLPASTPESIWCKARIQLEMNREPSSFEELMTQLQSLPFPDAPCMLADYHLRLNQPEAARRFMERCLEMSGTDHHARNQLRKVQLAVLEEDFQTLENLCMSADPDFLWTCLEGLHHLKLWPQLRKLIESSTLHSSDRQTLNALLFTDAADLVSSRQPPRDCSPKGIFLRQLWIRRTLFLGKTEQALAWHAHTTENCPFSMEYSLFQLELLTEAGFRGEAMELLEQSFRMTHRGSLYRLGKVALNLELPRTAFLWANTLIQGFPDDHRGFLLLAMIERQQNRTKAFLENLDIARKFAAHAPEILMQQALWEAYQGRSQEVETLMGSFQENDPELPLLWSNLAMGVVSDNPHLALRWAHLAASMFHAAQSPVSASWILAQTAEQLNPEYHGTELSRLVASLRKQESLHPRAFVFLSRQIQLLDRHHPDALVYLEKAVNAAPCNPEFRLRLGRLLMHLDKTRAEEEFQKILQLRKTSVAEEARDHLRKLVREGSRVQPENVEQRKLSDGQEKP